MKIHILFTEIANKTISKSQVITNIRNFDMIVFDKVQHYNFVTSYIVCPV